MRPLLSFLLLLLTAIPGMAQEATNLMTTDEGEIRQLPRWLMEFSNLPRETRTRYINTFNLAKQAYRDGRWIDCISLLVECEIIQRGNPGVWNLRASCLMEQKFFDEAAAELERVLQQEPDNQVALMNLANMHMACGRYTESLRLTAELKEMLPYETQQEVLNVLDFRALLCHLMQGKEASARALVQHLTPMFDTPFYYYTRAAFALAQNDISTADYCQRVASQIFANNRATEPYRRALELSGLTTGTRPVPAH